MSSDAVSLTAQVVLTSVPKLLEHLRIPSVAAAYSVTGMPSSHHAGSSTGDAASKTKELTAGDAAGDLSMAYTLRLLSSYPGPLGPGTSKYKVRLIM
jgi:acid phosphatase family membrane protein YuiD